MNIRELRDQRAAVVTEARKLVDLADQEKRGMSAEEEAQYTALIEQADKLGAEVEKREKLENLETSLAALKPEPSQGNEEEYDFQSRGLKGLGVEMRDDPEWRNVFERAKHYPAWMGWLRGNKSVGAELRALQADSDISGGFLYAPMQFVDRLIQAIDNLVYMRQWATIYSVANSESLGFPSLDTDPADPTWTTELAIGSEDSSMAFGRRELKPNPLAKYIKVSRKLLRKAPNVESLVMQRLGYKFAVTLENAYLNGVGVGQPLGVFTSSANGISSSRDVSTGNTTTAMTFDGLKEAKYTLKQGYWRNARWIFHRDGIKQLAKLKDGDGQYLWQPGVVAGEPDRLLGFPVFSSEYAPNTFTSALYVGILGDFSFYWIADSLEMEMQRLEELYAATNQVGFIGRLESDGAPVLGEAFVRVKLA